MTNQQKRETTMNTRKVRDLPKWTGDDIAVYPYLDCRALGHVWDYVDSNHWTAPWGEPKTLRCMRCTMEKRYMMRRGTDEPLGKPRYVQPEGYAFASGQAPRRREFLLLAFDDTQRRRIVSRRRMAVTVPHLEVVS
jgi:hypothetical protein